MTAPAIAVPPTVGVILAGGRARRLGGGDKGLLLVGGRPLLARVAATLRPQVAHLLLSANGDGSRLAPFGLPVVPDPIPGHPGPLAGLLAALDWTAAHAAECAWVVTAPADAPFLPADLVARLHASRGAAPMAVAASAGRLHPVAALVPVASRTSLRESLLSGQRKVGAFLEAAARADWPAHPVDPFFNVNTPEDLAAADRLAATLP